jgi:ABC-type multidrug transport system fused ATPase/permease subunit
VLKISRSFFFQFFLIALLNFFGALLEGASFACLLIGFSESSGKSVPFITVQNPLIWIGAALVIQGVRSCSAYIGLYAVSRISTRWQKRVQGEVYHHLISADYLKMGRFTIAELVEFSKIPCTTIPPFMEAINHVVVSGMIMLVIFIMMNYLSILLTLSVFVVLSGFILFQRLVIRKVKAHSLSLGEQVNEMGHQMTEALTGLRHFHLYDASRWKFEGIERLSSSLSHFRNRLLLWNGSIPSINEMISVCAIAMILCVACFTLKESPFSFLSLLLTYVTLTYRFANRSQIFWMALANLFSFLPAMKKLSVMLRELGSSQSLREEELDSFKKEISFHNVSFSYPGKESAALKEVSLTIPKGSFVGIVGKSGSGKSTLIDLLSSLCFPIEGNITIDGVNINRFTLASLRREIAVVSQDLFLCSDTIIENICFGAPFSEEEVIQAAKWAGAHEFIEKLQEGYYTRLGAQGILLSGGEKQRLSLARAFLRNASIWIFDEATSQLDPMTEQLIWNSIEAMRDKRTLIVISHELSPLEKADQIFVLDEGRIKEKGNHKQLLESNGAYHALWTAQEVVACS